MRVALLCGSYVPERDGVSDYVRKLAQALLGFGATPIVVSGGTASHGATSVTPGWSVPGTWRAAGTLDALSCDIVHVQWSPSAYGFRPAVGLLPLHLRTPLVTTIHEYAWWSWPRGVPHPVWRAVERCRLWDRESGLLALRSNALVTTNDAHAGALEQRLSRRPQIIPIGSNVDGPKEEPARARAAVRQRLRLGNDRALLVTFGFVHPVKGVRQLIDAVAVLNADARPVHLVVAGGGISLALPEEEAAAFRRELEQRIVDRGVQRAVTLTGYLAAAEISQLLTAADAIVLPFTAGVTTKSGALLAAMSHARPVLATVADVPDPDLVDGMTVVTITKRRDAQAIADAVQRLLDDPALASQVARGGAELAGRRSWPAIASRHAELYRRVLEVGWQ